MSVTIIKKSNSKVGSINIEIDEGVLEKFMYTEFAAKKAFIQASTGVDLSQEKNLMGVIDKMYNSPEFKNQLEKYGIKE